MKVNHAKNISFSSIKINLGTAETSSPIKPMGIEKNLQEKGFLIGYSNKSAGDQRESYYERSILITHPNKELEKNLHGILSAYVKNHGYTSDLPYEGIQSVELIEDKPKTKSLIEQINDL